MVVGALIVKHVEGLSDEKTIQENPYMQYKDCRVDCYNHPLGRPPKDETTATLRTRRGPSTSGNEVEATFGTSKRVYRSNDIRAKLDDTADTWIVGSVILLWLQFTSSHSSSISCSERNSKISSDVGMLHSSNIQRSMLILLAVLLSVHTYKPSASSRLPSSCVVEKPHFSFAQSHSIVERFSIRICPHT